MRATYLPVLSSDTLRPGSVLTPTDWMDPRLPKDVRHPYALVSFAYWSRARFRFEHDEFVFGDSGGYSVLTQGRQFDPLDVLRWQVRNCTVGCLLDTPPFAETRHSRAVGFPEGLRQTLSAAGRGIAAYRAALDAGSPFRWWGVVHGKTEDQLSEWFEAVRRVYPFDAPGEGWCFKPHPLNDSEAVARILAFCWERGIRNIHLFGTGKRTAIETLFALGPGAGIDRATYDTTSPVLAAVYRNLRIPVGYGHHEYEPERFRQTGSRPMREYMIHECPCISCRFVRQDLAESPPALLDESYWRLRMTFHNCLALLDEYRELERRYASGTDRVTRCDTCLLPS